MNKDDQVENFFCNKCSSERAKGWRGWPLKANGLPHLPKLVEGFCPECGSESSISSHKIYWATLESFWFLLLDNEDLLKQFESQKLEYSVEKEKAYGFPYFSEISCPKCNEPSVVSMFKNPKDFSEGFSISCKQCGLMNLEGSQQKTIDYHEFQNAWGASKMED